VHKVTVPTLAEIDSAIPIYSTAGSAGADVRAHIHEPLIVQPGEHVLISTGLKFAIPEGYEIQIRPRSGLAAKHGISLVNSPGTIDSDYRGEVKVILINHGREPFEIEPGMRIAQFVLAPVVQAEFVIHEDLVGSTRGDGGFGSTGTA
jgi:dUTP diphosphatase